jgi:hypothetical protein
VIQKTPIQLAQYWNEQGELILVHSLCKLASDKFGAVREKHKYSLHPNHMSYSAVIDAWVS